MGGEHAAVRRGYGNAAGEDKGASASELAH
jgi:hypothetical protein